MFKRFSRLDRTNTGSISKVGCFQSTRVSLRDVRPSSSEYRRCPGRARTEISRLLQLLGNPLAEHILNTLDADRDKTVDFEEFVKVLSAFSSGGEPGEKLRCDLNPCSCGQNLCAARYFQRVRSGQ